MGLYIWGGNSKALQWLILEIAFKLFQRSPEVLSEWPSQMCWYWFLKLANSNNCMKFGYFTITVWRRGCWISKLFILFYTLRYLGFWNLKDLIVSDSTKLSLCLWRSHCRLHHSETLKDSNNTNQLATESLLHSSHMFCWTERSSIFLINIHLCLISYH